MTNREALIILAAGFANQEYTAAGAVEEAVAALKLIDEHLAAQPVPEPMAEDADPLKRYPWAALSSFGDVIDMRTGKYPITWVSRDNTWTAWVTPDCKNAVRCGSFDEASRAVNWPEWDRGNAQ